MFRRSGVVALACVFATSCSWAFVKPPPADYDDPEDCTSSSVAPVADTAFAVLSAFLAIGIATMCHRAAEGGIDDSGEPLKRCGAGEYLGLANVSLLGIATTFSAASGYRHTRRCRDLRTLDALQVGRR